MPDIVHGWSSTGLRGLAALLFGFGAFLFPVPPAVDMIALFGVYALIDGALALAAARARAERPALRVLLVGEGAVGVGAGLLAFFFYSYWSVALHLLVAAWVAATGVLRVGEALRHRDRRSRWLLLLAGLGSLPIAYLLFALPTQGAPRLLGAYAVGLGAVLLTSAGRPDERLARPA